MRLKVSVRAKHAPPANATHTTNYYLEPLLLLNHIAQLGMQSGLQIEHLWPPASRCTGHLDAHVELEPY